MPYQLLADLVLVLHVGIVLFVVGGLALIVVGNLVRWHWVNRWSFRLLHLIAIVVVVTEAWLDIACPLTTLEYWLRDQAGMTVDAEGFIAYWLSRLLYYPLPPWVLLSGYTLFGALVAIAWWRYPPKRHG